MRKKIARIVLVFALILSLVACSAPAASVSGESVALEGSATESTGAMVHPRAMDETIETEIVVVGGGGTGLTAALSAAEAGKKVVLIEKLGFLGGATQMSAGKVPAAGTKQQADAGIEDTAEALKIDIMRPGDYGQRSDLVELVAGNSAEFIEWSEGHGVEWSLETDLLYYGQTVNRMHVAEGEGVGLVKALAASAEANENITIMLNTKGTGLVAGENGTVNGVTAEAKDGKTILFRAGAVILATSGFGANRDMVERYIPSIQNAYPLVAPGATGEGILWGMDLGARVNNMGAYQGYAPIAYESKKSLGQGMLNSGGVLINSEGRRFMDEYTGYSNVAAAVVNQTDAFAYMVWDETIAASNAAKMEEWRTDGILLEAATAAELAGVLGVPVESLQHELDAYAKGIETGRDYLDRTFLPERFEGPYYALKVTGDFRHTQGGLSTDLTGRVLREDGSVIEGLYAGGGVTEGFSSSGGPGYMSGNGLLQALVLGKLAGEEAAKL